MKKKLVIPVLLLLLTGSMFGQKVKVVSVENYISKCLYNFSWYVNWPEQQKDGEFVFAVVGDSKVYDELVKVTQNKKVGLQNVKVVYYKKIEEMTDYNHVVFLAQWQSNKAEKALEKIGNTNTLIVTHKEGGAPDGSAINFFPKDGMMQFEVKKSNAVALGLQVSSRLENMAYRSL
jgi:hypothetical protein